MTTEKHVPTLCPKFERGFQLIGKKWNGLIIQSLLNEPLRFGQLRDSINGISDRVLIERLRQLGRLGIVCRKTTEIDSHQVALYSLTEKGLELEPVLNNLHQWADEWMAKDDNI